MLSDETPNSVLEFEALRTAGQALLKLNRPLFALSILERARKIDPDDLKARQLEGMALGRAERYAKARETLQKLTEEFKDGETQGIFARTCKDEWTQFWNAHELRKTDPLAAARDTAPMLESAAAAYADAFRAAPADYYPGINALTLGRLWEHITGEKSNLPLDLIAAGVSWSVDAAIANNKKDYWALATRAELALVEGMKSAFANYSTAAAVALTNRDRFALDSSGQQLDFLCTLNFRPEIAREAATIIDRAEKQLDGLIGARAAPQAEPQNVVVFSGHMIDNPAVRGAGKAKPPRFPSSKIDAAALGIRAALDRIGAHAGDIGLCGGACGGDLLFAEACIERGMRVELRLARTEPEFLGELVTFADRDHRWEQSFMRVKENPATKMFVMPDELGAAPEGSSVHARCNQWILYTGLSGGLKKVSFIALWDGQEGDGPGGTKHMVELVRKLTGRQPEIIDPATL